MNTDLNIEESIRNGLSVFFAWLPQLVGALVILFVGYLIALTLSNIVQALLKKIGLEKILGANPGGNLIRKVVPRPSKLVGTIVFWSVFLGALSLAVSVLGIPALTAFVAAIYSYLPNVLAALLIFLAAGAVSAAVSALVVKTMGDTPTGKMVAAVVPALVMGIAIFMILNQLMIAPEIITITYSALIGSVALGMALAFGLGGREVAAQLLQTAYDKGKQSAGQAKQDLQTGKQRGQELAQEARNQAEQVR